MKKVCNICFIEKELSEYYTNKGMCDGYQNRCKECTKKKTKEKLLLINSDPTLKELEKARHREKYHRLNYKEKHKPTPEYKREVMKRYNEKYPEKRKAKAVADKLPKKDGYERHHWSYNKEHWADVIEISNKDHNTTHRFMVYDQERMMFRKLTGELLDTKLSHMNYIDEMLTNKL
jgi:hypothetical protein